MNPFRTQGTARSNRPSERPEPRRESPRTSVAPADAGATNGAGERAAASATALDAAHAIAGSLALDGSLRLANRPGESETLSVTHGFEPCAGLVTGLHVRGDLILGRTPSPESASACGFLTVAGGASRAAPPALVVDGAIQSPPRAGMIFVLRGAASAGMIALWSGHLLGDGRLSLHDGARGATDAGASIASGGAKSHSAGAIGAFLGPNLTVEPFGCDAVTASHGNHRLPRAPEYGEIEFGMGVVMQRSTLRLRVGPVDRDGRANDRLACRGTLHLGDSRLEIASAFLDRPSEVTAGTSFVLVEAGSICGELSSASLPALPNGLRFALERSATRIVLRAVGH